MRFHQRELIYELFTKGLAETDALKQFASHAVKEIKSTMNLDADVKITVESESKDKRLYCVSMSVLGLSEPVIVKKQGKNVLAVFRKAKRATLRQIHRINKRRITIKRKQFFKEQCAS